MHMFFRCQKWQYYTSIVKHFKPDSSFPQSIFFYLVKQDFWHFIEIQCWWQKSKACNVWTLLVCGNTSVHLMGSKKRWEKQVKSCEMSITGCEFITSSWTEKESRLTFHGSVRRGSHEARSTASSLCNNCNWDCVCRWSLELYKNPKCRFNTWHSFTPCRQSQKIAKFTLQLECRLVLQNVTSSYTTWIDVGDGVGSCTRKILLEIMVPAH